MCFNQLKLPLPLPLFHPLFTYYRIIRAVKYLIVDKRAHSVSVCETGNRPRLMFGDSPNKIVGRSDVERSVALAGKGVDEAGPHLCSSGLVLDSSFRGNGWLRLNKSDQSPLRKEGVQNLASCHVLDSPPALMILKRRAGCFRRNDCVLFCLGWYLHWILDEENLLKIAGELESDDAVVTSICYEKSFVEIGDR